MNQREFYISWLLWDDAVIRWSSIHLFSRWQNSHQDRHFQGVSLHESMLVTIPGASIVCQQLLGSYLKHIQAWVLKRVACISLWSWESHWNISHNWRTENWRILKLRRPLCRLVARSDFHHSLPRSVLGLLQRVSYCAPVACISLTQEAIYLDWGADLCISSYRRLIGAGNKFSFWCSIFRWHHFHRS